MEYSRRHALAGAATAVSALASHAQTAWAQPASPTSTRQKTSSVYRRMVGGIALTCISDGSTSFPRAEGYVSNVNADEVAKALTADFLPTERIILSFTPVVLETAGRVVVVDTGVGQAAFRASNGVGGQFHANLSAAGYHAASVNQVLITHFHADHIGGLVTEDGKAAFPDAEIFVPMAEYAFWMDTSNAARATSNVVRANFERAQRFMGLLSKQIRQYEPEKEVVPGVTSIATPGHTPGHSSFIITSDGQQAIIQGDVTTHQTIFVDRPDWHVWSDMDPVLAEQSRRKLYDRAAAEKILLQGFHFNFPALGRLSKIGNGYRFVPVNWVGEP